MSTTRDLNVTVKYAVSKASLIFKLQTKSAMVRGADLQWLSAFPNEQEICATSPRTKSDCQLCSPGATVLTCARCRRRCRLFQPLTFLQPTGRQFDYTYEIPRSEFSTHVKVVEVEPVLG
eukprot:7233750-Prymnesium_polylepis.1